MPIELADAARLPPDFVVFFCWQDHLDKKFYRYLIRDAIYAAIARIQSELPAGSECKLRQDSDTMDRAGAVEIANTICQKIRASTVVIADVTPVFMDKDKGWFYPNPNVMLEAGYAGAAIGWNRVICLYDEAACKAEQLPFDIRHRRATSFSHFGGDKKKAASELEGMLYVALRAVVQEIARGALDPALGDAGLRRMRDLRLIRDVLSTFDVNALDYYIKRGLEGALVYDILFFWHGFEAVVESSEFRFYDELLQQRLQELYEHWGEAINSGSMLYSPNGVGGYSMKGDEIWGDHDQERYDKMMAGLERSSVALKALLDHVHKNYAEIDIRDTNKAAFESVKKYLEPPKK